MWSWCMGVVSCAVLLKLGVRCSSFDEIQTKNLGVLEAALKDGYLALCESKIDPGILSFYGGGDPRDASVELIKQNENLTLPLKEVQEILFDDMDYEKKLIIYINGFIAANQSLLSDIRSIVKCSNAYDVLLLDFARSLPMLYNTAMFNTPVFAYAVLRVLDTLIESKMSRHNIILVGHSQGAQIAALAAKLFIEYYGWKLPLLVALDPAVPCNPDRQHVNEDLAEHVLVIHTSGGEYSIQDDLGTIDYYPNGAGAIQPGCDDHTSSHLMAVKIFAESVCCPGSFMAVRCKDWNSFQNNKCQLGGVIPISLKIRPGTRGKYFSITRRQAPFGLGFTGISMNRQVGWWNHDI